jgi:hypothetical protein
VQLGLEAAKDVSARLLLVVFGCSVCV